MPIFHAACLLALFLLRTTDLGRVVPLLSASDVFLPYVMALGFFRPLREGAVTCGLLALLLDLVSAAPPGLYLVLYGSVYAAAWWLPRFLEPRNVFFLILANIVAAVAEDLFFWSAGVVNFGAPADPQHLFTVLARDAGIAAAAGWILVLLAEWGMRRFEAWAKRWRPA